MAYQELRPFFAGGALCRRPENVSSVPLPTQPLPLARKKASEAGADLYTGASTSLNLEKARPSRLGEKGGNALDKGKSSRKVRRKPV